MLQVYANYALVVGNALNTNSKSSLLSAEAAARMAFVKISCELNLWLPEADQSFGASCFDGFPAGLNNLCSCLFVGVPN